MKYKTIIVSAMVGVIVLGASHAVIRNSPIEINRGSISSVLDVCGGDPDKKAGLEYVLVDRYPPYRWEAHCTD